MSKNDPSQSPEEFLPEELAAQLAPEVIRSRMEGTWVMIQHPGFPADDWMDESEEQELFIVQDEEDELRFAGVYEDGDFGGTFDLRLMPFFVGEDGYSFSFSFHEDTDIDVTFGSGFLVMQEENVLTGMKMHHLEGSFPIFWRRVSPDLPDLAHDLTQVMIGGDEELFLNNFDDEEGDEDDLTLEDLEEFLEIVNAKPESLEELFEDDEELLALLKAGNFHDINSLVEASDEELLSVKGVTQDDVDEIRILLGDSGLYPPFLQEVDEEKLLRVFKVRIHLDDYEGVFRDIEVLGENTLHDLHTELQVAFDWDDDHLYSFYMSGEYGDDSTAISHPFAGDELDSTEVQIAELGLVSQQKFVYIFDYADEWRHTLEVLSIGDTSIDEEHVIDYPKTTASEGESPQQYEDYDED